MIKYTKIQRCSVHLFKVHLKKTLIISCLLPFLLFSMSYKSIAEEYTSAINNPNVITFGLGIENGFFGFKYGRMLNNPHYRLGLGLGIEGISPHITYIVYDLFNKVSLTNSAGIHSSPNGGLIMNTFDTLVYYGIGFELRPKSQRRLHGYFHIGMEAAYFIKQKKSGNTDFVIFPNFQFGLLF